MAHPIVRTPRYLTRFRCIGPACEDHCCGGWQNVDVDVETYARYRRVDHPQFGPALQRHVRPNPEPTAAPEEHALIEVPGAGSCPFFDDERLCAIQLRLGEELLPASCDTFPRQATLIGGMVDLAARFSCPEVVRLALLAPDALELVVVEPERRLRERGRYWVEEPWSDLPSEDDPRHHYHQVRELAVDLLRRREASLAARLRALGLALAALSDRPTLRGDEVDRAFAEALARLATLQRRVDEAPPGPPALLLQRVRPWIAMQGIPPRYRACLDRLRAGLKLPSDPTTPLDERVADAYAAALPRFRAYLQERPYLLQHALLNHLHLTNFPFHPALSFFEEYALLVCRHALLELHLIGATAAEGALSDALVVETVQAFDKYADRPDYWQRTLALLRRHDALNLSSLSALLLD